MLEKINTKKNVNVLLCVQKNDVINKKKFHIVTRQETKIGSDNPRISKIKEKNIYLLPPQLYSVVFYQVILVKWTRITCSDFRRPSVLLLGSCVVLYHMFIPHGGLVINVLA